MIIYDQPAEAYHKAAEIGSTTAKTFLTSPRLFKDRIDGIDRVEDRPHFQVGRAAHLMVLEPERFEQCVTTKGPINAKTGKPFGRDTIAFAEWQAANPGIMVVEPWLYLALERMPDAVCDLIKGGRGEVSVYAPTKLGFGVKCRPDYLLPGLIVDLKTIDSVDHIGRAIARFKYWFSAGWYRMVMNLETGSHHQFRLVFMEKKAPYRWRIVDLAPDYMAWADHQVDDTLAAMSDCYRTDYWNDPGDVVQVEQMPSYLDNDEFTMDGEGISL